MSSIFINSLVGPEILEVDIVVFNEKTIPRWFGLSFLLYDNYDLFALLSH